MRQGKVLASDVVFPQVKNFDWYEDEAVLWQDVFSEFVTYFYSSDPQLIPPMILVNQSIRDAKILTQVLEDLSGHRCQIQKPQRGNKKNWLQFATQNLSQALETKQTSWASLHQAYLSLAKILQVKSIRRLEGFDISHTLGEATVASCVVFNEQGPLKKDYRCFNIEGIQAGDDYAAMRQVLQRRAKAYAKNPDLRPDVVVIDGGLGQVRVAKEVLGEAYVILGISKGPLRKAGMEKLILAHGERVFSLDAQNKALHLLQHLRDEAHRFAISHHRQKRQKRVLDSSILAIPGIGPVRRRQLLQFFGGIQDLARASIEEIAKVPGIHEELAKKVFAHFHS